MLPIGDTIPTRNFPAMTRILILVNAVIFFLEFTLPESQIEKLFFYYGAVPRRLVQIHLWINHPLEQGFSILSSMFLHGGFLHVFTNMWTLWIFGDNVEDRMGPVRFLAFYLLCGFAAMVVHVMTNPFSMVPTVGASGAIAGVLGAYLALFPHSTILTFVPFLIFFPLIPIPAVVFLFFWFFSQFLNGMLSIVSPGEGGGIAWWAHIGGFIAGLYVYSMFVSRSRDRPQPGRARPPSYRF